MGCKPDYLRVDLYTSDYASVLNGEAITVPVEMKFSGHVSDENDDLQKIIQISKKYLGKTAEYTRSNGDLGDEVIVIKSQLPMALETHLSLHLNKLENKNLPMGLALNSKNFSVYLVTTEALERFNQELSVVNFMLTVEMIPETLTYNVVSDERTRYQVVGHAVFVNGKPHLKFTKFLDRRESVAVDFSGEDGSIWKSADLRPSITIIPETK